MSLPETSSTVPKLLRIVIAAILGIVIGLTAMYLYSESVKRSSLQTLDARIERQLAEVTSMAEITDRNGADSTAASIIRDCPKSERIRFDELLDKLSDTIRWTELQELQQLFSSCGDFYATQKNLMVMRLEREVQTLADYIELRSILSGERATEMYRITDWRQLVDFERRQAETFMELVSIQRRIISLLIEGKTRTSPEIQAALEDARNVQELQMVLNIEIDTLRSSLVES